LKEESLGIALINWGGKLSLGPPLGGIILAQPVWLTSIINNKIAMTKKEESNFFMNVQ
jgi:hypothetical protein